MAIKRAREALELFVTLPIEGSVLDIGSEDGSHAEYMKSNGLKVITLDPYASADIRALWPVDLDFKVGAIWCSHSLEHSRNPGAFLDACKKALVPNGWLAITVPPLKNEIVGGHATLWNAGLLLYNLILAGFDCSKAKVKTYGYNISVIVQNKDAALPSLKYNAGDIEVLARFFPVPVKQGFDGTVEDVNWDNFYQNRKTVHIEIQILEKTIEIDGIYRDVYHLGFIRVEPRGEGLGRLIMDWCVDQSIKNNKFCCVGTATRETCANFHQNIGWYNCGDYDDSHVIVASKPLRKVILDEK